MKDQRSRIILILAVTLFSAWVVSDPKRFRLGPDLAGGTILIYQKATQEGPAANVEKLLPALKERLDPAGLYNYVIRALGTDRVEIIMPEAMREDVDRVKRLVSTVGQLQFKIVANNRRHQQLMERAAEAWPNKIVGQEGNFVRYGVWKPVPSDLAMYKDIVAKAQAEPATAYKALAPGVRFRPASEFPVADLKAKNTLVKKGADGREYVLARWDDDQVKVDDRAVRIAEGTADRAARAEEVARQVRSGSLVNLVFEDETGDRFVLLYEDPYRVTGEYLTRVEPTTYEGSPAVSFNFNAAGARLFLLLTTEFQPEKDGFKSQLGVVLDNRVRSAPNLNARISSSGVITGNFSQAEVQELVQILDAGQLPFALSKEPSSQFQIAPTLGQDTIRRGAFSIALALALVIIFVVGYYRYAGMIAIFGLLLNLLFTVGLMVLFKATWTLPGLAGLVLTVGMSVDANILIFERMREEIGHGASLGMAIRNGYDKAFSAILDGNLTTIVTAIILFAIGTDQVKGFAVTLILGILTSMFAALYVTRTIFDLLYSRRWLRRLSMLKIMENPHYDFLRTQNLCFAISGAIIAVGLAAILFRGARNFDIDFTGGTMVGIHLNQKLDISEVRRLASEEARLPDVAVEEVRLTGDDVGSHFVLRTTARDNRLEAGGALADTVGGKIAKAFGPYLLINKVQAGKAEPIAANVPTDSAVAAFAGGQQSLLHFEPPASVAYIRDQLADILTQQQPGQDPNNLYTLIPVEAGSVYQEASGRTLYREMRLASRLDLAKLTGSLSAQLASTPEFDQFNQFGPQVASETQLRALWAIVLSWVSIIVYVWFRFGSWTFGLAGVMALVHDVLVAVGLTALVSILADAIPALHYLTLSDMKINLNGIAAILTLIGYSINDTIVIFDRIREVRGKSPRLTRDIVNRSVNETLSRTIFTSLTVFFGVVVLYFGCGVDLRGFSFILVIGTITGVYSTIYIANPVLLLLSDWQERRKERPSRQPAPLAALKGANS